MIFNALFKSKTTQFIHYPSYPSLLPPRSHCNSLSRSNSSFDETPTDLNPEMEEVIRRKQERERLAHLSDSDTDSYEPR